MARAWACPECGTYNSVDATECSSCGRWASVFDLERTVEVGETASTTSEAEAEPEADEGEWQQAESYEQEPGVPAGPRPTAKEVGRSVLDTIRETTSGGPREAEAEPEQSRAGSIVKWVVIGLALLWFVLPPLLNALD